MVVTFHRVLIYSIAALIISACAGGDGPEMPGITRVAADEGGEVLRAAISDDPADWDAQFFGDLEPFQPEVSNLTWLVPSDALPTSVEVLPANNNVDVNLHAGDMFLAWRTAPTHFADPDSRMPVIRSGDGGQTWNAETTVAIGADIREPRLLDFADRLQLLFFEGGTNPVAFEPKRVWRVVRQSEGVWSAPEVVLDRPEVPWDIKVRGGRAWMTSYIGDHYDKSSAEASIDVRFLVSDDGERWDTVDGAEYVYQGGVSEAAFEFDADGNLWVVTRNEDGDASGFGSHVCFASSRSLSQWECPAESSVHRYDSPEMFRHHDTVYLLARRDPDGPFGPEGDLITYSLRRKATALYRIAQDTREVVHITDLPGCGDTAFPAVRRMGRDTFIVANYTSPLHDPDIPWLEGQLSERGTQIYTLDLTFSAGSVRPRREGHR